METGNGKWRPFLGALALGIGLILLLGAAFSVGLAAPDDPIRPVPIFPEGQSSIGDYVWLDANVDGYHETTVGEQEYKAGIDNVLINLYLDADYDGQIDAGEFLSSTLTGDDLSTPGTETGWYLFPGLTADGNQYIVEVDPSNFDPGGPLDGLVHTSYNTYGPNPLVVLLPGLIENYVDADFGFINAGIEITKTPDLQYVIPPGVASFTIQVTNTGGVTLTNVTVSDPQVPNCNTTILSLAPGATVSYSCSASGVTTDFTNVATVTGTPTGADGQPLEGVPDLTDEDDAVVDVIRPGLQLTKTVSLNGSCPGSQSVVVPPGTSVTYCYEVTNTGDTYLINIQVTDNVLGSICSIPGPLAPGASQLCSTTTTVTQDTTNVGTATGQPSDPQGQPLPQVPPVTDEDDAVVDVANPAIEIIKTVSLTGSCPGSQSVSVLPGTNVTYCYRVTNTGDTYLSSIQVSDNKVGAVCTIPGPLAPGNAVTCSKAATINQDTTNIGTATGQPSNPQGQPLPGIPPVSDEDDAVVDVVNPAIQIIKTVSLTGSCPGSQSVSILSGTSVTYCYQVTNTGDTYLNNIQVTDNILGSICTIAGSLAPGGSQTCTAIVSVSQDTTNVGTATGQPSDPQGGALPGIPRVTDDDDAVVDVVNPAIQIVKTISLNGQCPGSDPVSLPAGTPVTYCYQVTNTGDTYLSQISVTDNLLGPICNIAGPLAPGASQTCTATATINQTTTNLGTATGQPSNPQGQPLPGIPPVRDDDPATATVVGAPGILLVKTAGNAPDGQVLYLNQTPPATVVYTFAVTNIGNTYLSNIRITDNVYGAICVIPGPLAPGASTFCQYTANVTGDVTNLGTATGTPSDPNGNPTGQPDVSDTDDAVVQFLGAIGDFVWWDMDADGVQDPGEPGIPNVDVVLTRPDNSTVTTTTDANGIYSFPNLPAGTYTVAIAAAETQPGGTLFGWTPTFTPPMPVNLGPGQVIPTVDFGWDIRSAYTLSKVVNTQPQPVRTGDPISFTIRITNTGSTWISVLPLRDIYNTTYLSYGYLGSYASPASDDNNNDGQIDWSDLTVSFGTDLAPGLSFSVVVTFTAKADTQNLPNQETINTAIVQGAYADPDGPQGPLGGEELLPTQESSDGVSILQPTGFDLSRFDATAEPEGVRLVWQTATELDILGFNLWRQDASGQPVQVNGDLILAQHSGANRGDTYSVLDAALQPGTYSYVLEVVRLDGSAVRYRPLQVTIQASN